MVTGGRKDRHVDRKKKGRTKGREALLKEANRRLAQNPKDPESLSILGDIYYGEEAWDKALKTYEVLVELCGSNSDLDEFEINMRYGMAAMKLGRNDEAYKGLVIARTLNQSNFEVNYNLGYLEFLKKNYEKAIQLLQQARTQDPDTLPRYGSWGTPTSGARTTAKRWPCSGGHRPGARGQGFAVRHRPNVTTS
jgi:tetratricopeptide (TPR) repeat protein